MQSIHGLKGCLDWSSALLVTNVNISNLAPFKKTRILSAVCSKWNWQTGGILFTEEQRNLLGKLSGWSCRSLVAGHARIHIEPGLFWHEHKSLPWPQGPRSWEREWCDVMDTGSFVFGMWGGGMGLRMQSGDSLILPTLKSPILCWEDLSLHMKQKVALFYVFIVFICHSQQDCALKVADRLKKNTSEQPD